MLFIPDLSYTVITLIIRLAWASMVVMWHSLALMMETLTTPNKKISVHQKIFFPITLGIVLSYMTFIIGNFFIAQPSQKSFLEFRVMQYSMYYCGIILTISTIIVLYRLRKKRLPRIIKRQASIFLKTIVLPLVVVDLYYASPTYGPDFITSSFTCVSLSTMLLTYAIYYCARKIINLRFLNLYDHVHDNRQLDIVHNFKEILEQLNTISTKQELTNITKSFFRQSFNIPTGISTLYFRNCDQDPQTSENIHIEHLLIHNDCNKDLLKTLQKQKILIFDEIEFNHFHESTTCNQKLLNFMQTINADLFVPIYENQTIIGYIIVERDARINELYNTTERDEIIVFARFVSNIITLLRNHKIESVLLDNRQLKEDLYKKHQEINQYKESIHTFLEQAESYKKIGILFYKNRQFIFANQYAKELIYINPSLHQGHPLAQDLKELVKAAQQYQTTQTKISSNDRKKLVLTAIPNLDAKNIIILAHYPGISDLIHQQTPLLKNPSEWDYLLYLETTKSGTLINKAIPGNGKTITNLKINLLKASLSKEILFVQAHSDDLTMIVEILHHISFREKLQVLSLNTESNNNLTIKLFGIDPLFGTTIEKPIFETNDGDTLFIENIHLMDTITQEHLLHYVTYGYYQAYKGEQPSNKFHLNRPPLDIPNQKSDIRIICSTHIDLNQLVRENKLIPELYEKLRQNTLTFPSLFNIQPKELAELAESYAKQSIKHNNFKNLLALTPKEKQKIIKNKPMSIKEFKKHVHHAITMKSKKHNIDEIIIEPAHTLVDPELRKISQLGKHALRDPHSMSILWKKFKNQNKIATFLGVNRSSVNRRCKKYNIH
jgi:transcriptional regulator of acetoin/glycerol metabolism